MASWPSKRSPEARIASGQGINSKFPSANKASQYSYDIIMLDAGSLPTHPGSLVHGVNSALKRPSARHSYYRTKPSALPNPFLLQIRISKRHFESCRFHRRLRRLPQYLLVINSTALRPPREIFSPNFRTQPVHEALRHRSGIDTKRASTVDSSLTSVRWRADLWYPSPKNYPSLRYRTP